MVSTIFVSIIAILAFNLLFSLFLEQLNLKGSSKILPDLISDVYDTDNYTKQQAYEKEKVLFSQIESIIGTVLIIALFAFKVFGALQVLVSESTLR